MADGAGVTLTLGHAGKNADYALGTDMLCGPTRMNPESKWDGEVTSWGTGPQDWNAESARSLEWSTVGNQRTQLDELEGFFSGIHNSSHPKHIQSFQTTFDSTLSSSCLPNCEENNRRVTSGAAFEQNFGSFPEFQDTMQSESYSSPAILLFDNGDLAQDYASANQNSQHISSSNQSTGAHKAIDFDMFLAEPQESSFPSRGFASFSNGALGITSSSMLISPSTISMNAGPFKNSTNRGKTRNTIKRTSKAPRSSSIKSVRFHI
ncbi:hypothetical protein L207DRAFT_196176 [Hyaloscypha variabilis F]|uniref:Uncharacterized protein n=1 Tax=Hyaloscypha variabilis (strain UAMH 11265 / GT02V1 / F) TaxID=1149755 RepID=A0A2J6QXJ8_HYAVF|nr:hypothetical protein L207DRAFT_196176 [Hyaloscypha variabilis F]